jgi:hypothetical protein
MGRPPIGKQAMTDAERQRRHRAAQPVTKPVTKPAAQPAAKPDRRDQQIASLKARIAELEAARSAAPAATASPSRRGLAGQASSEDDRRERASQLSREQTEKIRLLQQALVREQILNARLKAQIETVPAAERDREMERLKSANGELRIKVKELEKWFAAKIKAAQMPVAVRRALQKCLAADPPPTREARVEALTLLMDWVNQDASVERKRPRQNR